MSGTLLSSKMTFFYKRILPGLWLAFLTVFVINSMMAEGQPDLLLKLVIVALLLIASYFLLFATFFKFVDEVIDQGTSLAVKQGDKPITITLKDIRSITYAHDGNPPTVTVHLKTGKGGKLGQKFSFMPITELGPFKKNEKITNLINRVERLQN